MNSTVSRITSSSPLYQQVWDLREEILRKPLGMSLKNEDLSRDHEDIIFVATDNEAVTGCVMLHRIDNDSAQLRQMAVYAVQQGKGVGRLLVHTFEAYAAENGYSKIVLHARKEAMGFYKSLNYAQVGDEFTEVGIPHFIMEKEIK